MFNPSVLSFLVSRFSKKEHMQQEKTQLLFLFKASLQVGVQCYESTDTQESVRMNYLYHGQWMWQYSDLIQFQGTHQDTKRFQKPSCNQLHREIIWCSLVWDQILENHDVFRQSIFLQKSEEANDSVNSVRTCIKSKCYILHIIGICFHWELFVMQTCTMQVFT